MERSLRNLLEITFECMIAWKAKYKVHHDVKRDEKAFQSRRNSERGFTVVCKCERQQHMSSDPYPCSSDRRVGFSTTGFALDEIQARLRTTVAKALDCTIAHADEDDETPIAV